MEGGAVGTSAAPDPKVKPVSMACLRRQAWARSRESIWQESKPEQAQTLQQTPDNKNPQRASEEPGQVPNIITSWLSECRTPLGASLDDQTPSPSKGPLRNGCSFEDDLSLGAEANHLQSNSTKPESCFGLAADQKRNQYKEKGRSMNSTGSGKSSTVSSVSELLDLYEEDPEEILFNLGFGREEPDLNAKIPSRFFNSSSSARGIDIKVYLKAQLQRMELENPNYALTSRFRQIEVLTTVANEFFQLYSQVSGQPVQRISSKDQETEGEEEGRSVEQPPPLKKSNSALNVAKFLKRTITKHNLLTASPESPEANTQLNGHTTAASSNCKLDNTLTNPEKEGCSNNSDHKVETVGKKVVRNKDNCSLATVTEESSGETDRQSGSSPEESSGGPESADLQLSSLSAEEEGDQAILEEEKNETSTQEKAGPTLTPPLLAQLRIENTDSFDMEEIQSNEDETLPTRTSRAADLLRQQSDSSGFAEDLSADPCYYLKVQESSDSCDSETTVTSHPSQEVVTPIALDQPVFVLPDTRQEVEEDPRPVDSVETDGMIGSVVEEGESQVMLEQFPQYTAHQLPKLRGMGSQLDDSLDEEREPETSHSGDDKEPEHSQSQPISEQDLQHVENRTETSTDPPAEDDEGRKELLDDQTSLSTPVSSYQVLSALNRAKQSKLIRLGQMTNLEEEERTPESRGRGMARRSNFRLQRSTSLPSSLPSPSRVVSSVKIQLGRNRTSSSQPRYSVLYPQEDEAEKEEEKTEEEGSVLSTLIINPGSSSGKKPTSSAPPKPIPSRLLRSCHSLHSYSPPPDSADNSLSWSTQSVPDLCSNHHPSGQFAHLPDARTQKSWTHAGSHANHPPPTPLAQYYDPIQSPSPSLNPYLSSMNTHPPLHPYASLPNLYHSRHPSINPHLSNLHHPSAPSTPHPVGPAHPATPPMHHQGYHHPYTSPYYPAQQFTSPYFTYQGYSVNSHLAFHHPIPQYPHPPPPPPAMTLEHHSLYPSTPGFIPSMMSPFNPTHSLHSGLPPPPPPPGSGLSSTEMQLRRVLHDIRGTVQSLSENRADTPDTFSDHRAALPPHQSLAEFQQRRRSLNLFRRQMMDLELSIMQQQALVYNHLSPADRMEVEKLQSLRSSVREELQELEQQLEERLVELMHNTQQRSHRSNSSVDNLSTASALRAMEPVSDLLSEQLYLQSELSYDSLNPSTDPSTRSSSPLRGGGVRDGGRGGGGGGGDSEQKQGLYRTSVDITPVPPPRPNTHTKKEEGVKEGDEEEEQQRDNRGGGGGGEEGGERGRSEAQEEKGAAGGVGLDNLQQLIREIRESVAQEVRQEIYGELLAAVTPQRSPVQTPPKHQRQ